MKKNLIHYNENLKLTVLTSEGDGACGEKGAVSSYHGMVTCKKCKELIEKEKAVLHLHMASTLSNS